MASYPDFPAEWRVRTALDAGHVCPRCGELVPPYWRHHMPTCRCVWGHGEIRDPDPACPSCAGTGFSPCQPQDLSVLRVSGVCGVCGLPAFRLASVVENRPIANSERHYASERDREHVAEVAPGPLTRVLGDYLDREASG